jgi:hypothetical protein
LLDLGFVYGPVARTMALAGMTAEHIGLSMIVLGGGQALLAAFTCYYRTRAITAFLAALPCLAVWLAYLGSDLAHTAMAWTWAAIMTCEVVLSWRVLLSRLAVTDALNGRERGV